jgi:heptosyltransferase I
MVEPDSILILKTSALGDVVMTLPLLRCLQRCFPSTALTWVVNPVCYTLLKEIKNVHWVVCEKPSSPLDLWRFYQRMKNTPFDVALSLQTSVRASSLLMCLQSQHTVGFDRLRNPEGQSLLLDASIPHQQNHAVESYMQFAAYLGASDLAVQWDLPLGDQEKTLKEQWQKQHPGQWVAVHPYSSHPVKDVSLEVYAAFIMRVIKHTSFNVLITGGPSDCVERLTCMLDTSLATHERLQVCGGASALDVLSMAALLSVCRCLVAPDTGALHMACALGVPVVGLYGATNPLHTGPYGFLDTVVNVYPAACEKYQHKPQWGKRLREPRAMSLIQVEDVWDMFLRVCPA